MRLTLRRSLHVVVATATAVLFLWLTVRHVDWTALGAVVVGVSPGWLSLAPVLLACGYACRTRRWQLMLQVENPSAGYARSGVALLSSIAVNNLLPFRAGDVFRCFAFTGWLGVAPGPVAATVLAERLLDLTVLIFALGLALWWLDVNGAVLGLGRWAGLVIGSAGIFAAALVLRPQLLWPVFAGLRKLIGLGGSRVLSKADSLLAPLQQTLARLADRRAMPWLMLWSLGAWFFEATTYVAVAQAIGTLTAPEAAWLAMPMGTLATLLPSSPGHVGTFDFFAQAAVLALDNPLAEATAFVLVVHVMLWLPTTLAGLCCLAVWSLTRASKGRPA
jgi:uncharacterized membrane protein YbhN (UPF0104 family)